MAEKYLDYSGADLLWKRIQKLLNGKISEVKNTDETITITNKNSISVKISSSEGNQLQKNSNGLYVAVPKMHKLTFGAGEEFVYDGSKDITVPVYDGTIEEQGGN